MNLSPKQQTLLVSLTTEWQTPLQIAEQLPKEWGDLTGVNQTLKDFMQEGWVQANPVMFGMYRLTADGTAIKESESGEN
ncbi:hypothetical protein [Paenibacillus nasutitermitis]|uniref:Uncharacterized protein n=1 Tax=Paenibacillus nasutitermitis TaxID=1652958 RepID=A0A917DXZ2_9BACL|nr:hypothetical protein [Paenibacillus nasutitermitis]GGD78212.1 hypothetical protein GCM10010911_40290 [Paenibacillus nasutitermitis]